jgi:hypothetical protein
VTNTMLLVALCDLLLCCSEYWRSASYLASTTGSLFSALVQTGLDYHAKHKRYQPFSVYQVLYYSICSHLTLQQLVDAAQNMHA